ncbi:hypothetical protein CA984_24025 [Streptosporangium minutum]|uniref:Uncharacterized protein n=1 Tax=Streptosporangium minutum TaxID=569862 RepID=A0A243RH68_9ACTN|nr:hypothetical protein CA984_24025 [Streptosporangium minutum]
MGSGFGGRGWTGEAVGAVSAGVGVEVSVKVSVEVGASMGDVVDRAVSTIWSSTLDVFTPIRRHTWSGPDSHTDSPRGRLSVILMNPASSESG